MVESTLYMSTISEELRAEVEAWRADDPDPATRAEVDELLERGDAAGLEDRFAGNLRFGTAGLRGLLGAGPNRMNRKVVLRATAGLCAHVLANTPDAAERGICIGFDGRRMSREFADDAARVCAGMGFAVYTFADVVPTPLLAYACLAKRAAAGIMVTASHNPPEYNGYKVYWSNGAQIIAPQDTGIAAAIEAVAGVDSIPTLDLADAKSRGLLTRLGSSVERAYLEGVRALQVHPGLSRDGIVIAYTALHGVGDRLARAALGEAGFSEIHSVAEQAEPDGAFPTVEFPNPEEKGAMDLVLALAEKEGAALVLANDPDADRLAVAVRDGDSYVQLNGNEVGSLLGHYLLDQGPAGDARLVVNTIVSSPMLGAIASAHGARFEQTLTGFKWIANTAMRFEATDGARFVFGYEEALGYTVGQLVRDKDGIGTAVVVADMAAWCRSQGGTLLTELERAWRRYGMYLSRQVAEVHPGNDGAAHIAGVMSRVRKSPPSAVGPCSVSSFIDLAAGIRRRADGVLEDVGLPRGDVLAMELDGGHRVMLRPSGTEPKIKFYFDARVEMAEGESVDTAKTRGEALIDDLVAGLAVLTEAP